MSQPEKTRSAVGKEEMLDNELELVIVQFPRQTNDVQKNMMQGIKIASNIEKEDHTTLLAFPELWITQKPLGLSEFIEITMPLVFLAMERELWISTGAHYVSTSDLSGENEKDKHTSVSTLITPEGSHFIVSEKLFPSKPMGERSKIRPGEILDVVDVGGIKVGTVICVDAMYPETARALALKGAHVILNPSSIPENRVSLWKSIAKTRAAENTVFWASIILTGTKYPDGRMVSGGSIVVDPAGGTVHEAGISQEVARVMLDTGLVRLQRARWPYLNDVYSKNILENFVKKLKNTKKIL